jgi:hypothetical protein
MVDITPCMKGVKNLNMSVSIVEANIPAFLVCVQAPAKKIMLEKIMRLQCKIY